MNEHDSERIAGLLEADGLVEAWEEQGPTARGGRPRRYYRLTAKGSQVALEERQAAGGLWGLLVPEGGR